MNMFSVKATLWEIERKAFDACYDAMCHGTVEESRVKALYWQLARRMLLANQN
jgi:hypothetical protein